MMSYYRVFSVGVLFLLSTIFVPHVWAQQMLENPQPDSFQSGIGVISGWACEATQIEIAFDGGAPTTAAYGTSRGDTQSVCGDTDNGFGLTFNWNLLDDGEHTVRALADGVEFATVTVTVTTLGAAFLEGKDAHVFVNDFPEKGTAVQLKWQEAQQNFVITHQSARPKPQQFCLVEVTTIYKTFDTCIDDEDRHEPNYSDSGQECDYGINEGDPLIRRSNYPYTCEGAVQFANACASWIAVEYDDTPDTVRLKNPYTYPSSAECLAAGGISEADWERWYP